MAEKVTVMVLKVDLQCSSCYKKIKTILCKIPQIRGQIYDVKQNTVTINVVCCSPKKIRDELCCKGGKVIKSIEIKEPETERCDEKKTGNRERSRSCKEGKETDQRPSPTVTGPEIRITIYQPARTCCEPCLQGYGGVPCYHGYQARPLCSKNYYGMGVSVCGCGCGCGRGCHLRKCVSYIEENPTAECKIMYK